MSYPDEGVCGGLICPPKEWGRLYNLLYAYDHYDDRKSNNDDYISKNNTLPKPIRDQYNSILVLLTKCHDNIIKDVGKTTIKNEIDILKKWSKIYKKPVNINKKSNVKGCKYFDLCYNIFKTHLNDVYSSEHYIGKYDYCFCINCHKKRKDKEVYNRGNPSRPYNLPIGWIRLALPITNQAKIDHYDIYKKWNVSFHGTKHASISRIAKSGFIFLKPGDYNVDGEQIAFRSKTEHGICRIEGGFERKNEFTGEQEMFDPDSIFTSQTIKYAGLPQYATPKKLTYKGQKLLCQFAFQLRQKNGDYTIGQTTSGTKNCDPNVSWKEYEYYTKNNFSIIVTGLLIKVSTPNDKDYKDLLKKSNFYNPGETW
mmetsp:Transcript_40285/g.49697  ORF Transcript_40285/g.49697 Transcript_40285/m.49697 type:complete len:368 (+) Transcript_40285:41-1144(+)